MLKGFILKVFIMIKFSFDLQTQTHKRENAHKSLWQIVNKEFFPDLDADETYNIMIRETVSRRGNQNNPFTQSRSGIDNGYVMTLNVADETLRTAKGKLRKNGDAYICMLPINGIAYFANDCVDKSQGGKFTKEYKDLLTERGIITVDRTRLVPSDSLIEFSQREDIQKLIAIIRDVNLDDDFERTTPKATVKKDIVVCSDDCQLAQVLDIKAIENTAGQWSDYVCPCCNVQWHVKGTKVAKTVVEDAEELIKQS